MTSTAVAVIRLPPIAQPAYKTVFPVLLSHALSLPNLSSPFFSVQAESEGLKIAKRAQVAQSASSPSTTSVYVKALDGLVSVNALFTIALFVGLSLTTPGQRSLENREACDAGVDVARNLLLFEVISFSFFLFSSIVAQGLKIAINVLNSKEKDEAFRAHINTKVLRLGMIGSAIGSVMGCLFLMLSMANVIQIRLGLLSCGSKSSETAVTTLFDLVSSALLTYLSTAVYAFWH